MKYSFEKVVTQNNGKRTMSFVLPKEIFLVGTFLVADIQKDATWFLEGINKVLSGKEEYLELIGNVCAIKIKKDFTKVVDMLTEDDIGDSCEIETSELKELIEIWIEEKRKFENQ